MAIFCSRIVEITIPNGVQETGDVAVMLHPATSKLVFYGPKKVVVEMLVSCGGMTVMQQYIISCAQ